MFTTQKCLSKTEERNYKIFKFQLNDPRTPFCLYRCYYYFFNSESGEWGKGALL